MAVNTLHEKFVYHLEEMYYVENQLLDLLVELRTDVANEDLQEALSRHRAQTEEHVARLEEAFAEIDEPPEQRPSPTFDALIEERRQLLQEVGDDEDMRDLTDLGTAAKNEHMEIAGYENLIMLARKLDLPRDVQNALSDNLGDEEQTKRQLKVLAEDSTIQKIFARLTG